MRVRSRGFAFVTDGAGAATGQIGPVMGQVIEMRVASAGTAWTGTGGTCDITLTRLRATDGGTILAAQNVQAPFQIAPVAVTHLFSTGAVAGTASVPGVPVADMVVVTIASALASQAGTIILHTLE